MHLRTYKRNNEFHTLTTFHTSMMPVMTESHFRIILGKNIVLNGIISVLQYQIKLILVL